MDPATLIGFAISIIALFVFMTLEGVSPGALIFLPAIVLVVIATFGAAAASQTLDDLKKVGSWFKMALMPAKVPPVSDRIATLVGLAEKARKEGLLALESQVKEIQDPFLKRGLQMGIDGTDPEELRAVLESEIAAKKAEDKVAAKFMNAMGGYAPTIGIVGCIVGLMNVMANLNEPASLGPKIAAAFVATLWGLISANFMWLPVGTRLKRISELELERMTVVMEGMLAVQAGSQPRLLGERLRAMVPAHALPKAPKEEVEAA